MAMTITEADTVTKLIHFVVSGELYTGQSDPARGAAVNLDYLGRRAAKVLAVTPAGDLETYAERLAPLAAGSDDRLAVLLEEAARAGRRATNDPGSYVKRIFVDKDGDVERLDRWQERALQAAVAELAGGASNG